MNEKKPKDQSASSQPKENLCHKEGSSPSIEDVSKAEATHRTLIHQEAIEDVNKVKAKTMLMKALAFKYTPTYNSHRNMKARCKAMEIPLAPEFEKFVDFLALLGPAPNLGDTIDRIDPTGPYSPSNVRWASKKVQARNRTNVRHLTYKGETLPLVVWAERQGAPASRMWGRVREGWTDEEIIIGVRTKKRVSVKPSKSSGTQDGAGFTPGTETDDWKRFAPWPGQDAEIWERWFQRSDKRCARVQYLLETCKTRLKFLEAEAEFFPQADEERTPEIAARELKLTQRLYFYSRGFKTAIRIIEENNSKRFDYVPTWIEKRLQQMFGDFASY